MQKQIKTPQTSWWQSIRWRLALGSILVVLLTTAFMATILVIAANIFYGNNQRDQIRNLADNSSAIVGRTYASTGSLYQASLNAIPNFSTQSATGEDYLQLVYSMARPPKLVYPQQSDGKILPASLIAVATGISVGNKNYLTLRMAISRARNGATTSDEIGQSRPFVVEPIYANGQTGGTVVGALLVIPRSAVDNTVPPFLSAVRRAILLVALAVAVLVALAALLFARTITSPLARLTSASRTLASGNYSARVQTEAKGELGELAHSFNEMATRLEQDVYELRQQELRRRELIMNITHDLATPLTAIAGLGEALADGVGQNPEDFEETGRVIVRETLRLRRLVKDLHMMAKAGSGAMRPQRKAVRLAPLVDEVFAALTPEFERVDVEPRNNLSFNLAPVWADPDMLVRVFDNLCGNALRYTPAGGNVAIDALQQGTMIEISVTDSGKGIPTSALPRIFVRFYRADPARQATTGGSGLGLAIVRAIVEAHGGSVTASNAPSGGARITFTLPLASADWEQLASQPTLTLVKGTQTPQA